MLSFLDKGWTLFATGKMQNEDTNKDGQGKGTLQRFLESSWKELDEYSIDRIDNLVDNVLDPTTCEVRYLKHFESWFGITVFPSYISDVIRRKVISGAMFYYKKKATRLGITALFNLIDSTIVITEAHNDFSFDSPVTFDDTLRRFDMGKCFGCSSYSIAITRGIIPYSTPDYYLGCYSIIKFNHPIGGKLDFATIGGTNLEDLMLAYFVSLGGTSTDITNNNGYYIFTQGGNIVASSKSEGNLKVVSNQLFLNI